MTTSPNEHQKAPRHVFSPVHAELITASDSIDGLQRTLRFLECELIRLENPPLDTSSRESYHSDLAQVAQQWGINPALSCERLEARLGLPCVSLPDRREIHEPDSTAPIQFRGYSPEHNEILSVNDKILELTNRVRYLQHAVTRLNSTKLDTSSFLNYYRDLTELAIRNGIDPRFECHLLEEKLGLPHRTFDSD